MRKRKCRNISADHSKICFKPCGMRGGGLEEIILFEDEAEALRLADYEGLYQQECAQRMQISRTTFVRLIESARKKVSDALLHQKKLKIQLQGENNAK
ncbi:MAG: DUF134 domain-containing protein [Epsilonproteobacteria bacterium]|nr:DUF134 domain-containing protein [Campylobacterota bacterium]